ncbi:MAG: hypothetical protein IJU98_02705 [Synergistaceae bacterium]|nr:hypothetical protein [Synergistaceae bacterium]
MKRRTNPLPLALCAAALVGGAWVGVVKIALSRLDAKPEGHSAIAPVRPSRRAPQVQAVPVEPAKPIARELAERPEPEPRASAPTPIKPQPQAAEKPKRPAPRPAAKTVNQTPDLSAYRVNAIRADRASLLPKDTSLSARDLNRAQAADNKKKAPFEGGEGLIGDVYRGTKRIVDSVDEATLNASRKALGGVAKPDKATLRPSGNGVRLHLEIPPETVRLGR